jgi:hypothetical protein
VFRLTKWYVDVVTPEGSAFIGYAARLAWGPVRLRYRAYLLTRPGAPSSARQTLAPTRDPRRDPGGVVEWRCGRLGLEGRWSPVAPAFRRRLYSAGSGSVDWECVAPAARARVRVGAEVLAGWGYAERLELTVPPWELPLDELRWGRFVGPDAAVVWVDWRGEAASCLVLVDGVEQVGAVVSDSELVWGSAILRLSPPHSLREGALGDVVAAIPLLSRFVPERLLRGWESKRLSRGALTSGDEPAREGWAIHEVVRWPSRVPA